jgi:hypothetical protein
MIHIDSIWLATELNRWFRYDDKGASTPPSADVAREILST